MPKKEPSQDPPTPSEKGIQSRFMALLSAQGVDGIGNMLFFLYLAWLDTAVYGAVMYALAAGSLVMKVIQFGLYYPLISDLTAADQAKAPEILNRVNIIKLGLFGPCMFLVLCTGFYRGFSHQTTIALVLICLGFALEALAETFFADFRVRGKQAQEARIKMASSVFSYGYGFVTAAMGFDLVVISLFKIVSAAVRLGFGFASHLRAYPSKLFMHSDWPSVFQVFKSASVFALIEILGIVYNRTNIFFLESYTGVNGVAYYSATFNIVDEISVLASEQFLGWVIFPLLASFWWNDRDKAERLVKSTGVWLMAFAFPIMFFMFAESQLIIGLVYPPEYKDAVWMQQYLVWTIVLSFENNLFAYLMMVAGGVKVLLAFSLVTTIVNLILNSVLVESFGLAGGCLVIILTKLVMMILTFVYCRFRFSFIRERDFIFPIVLAGFSFAVFQFIEPYVTLHPAVLITMGFYFVILWQFGTKFLGPRPRKIGSSI
jgi:O-antigen/teichoic acid export membrane protein